MSENFECYVVDGGNEILLQRESDDIIDVKYDGICLNIYVEKEFYERIDEFDVFESGIHINDVIFDVLPIEKDTDDKCLIQYIERSKEPLIKFAIAFASEPLSGDINISVIED